MPSSTAKRLSKQKYGFRNDELYDSGVTDFKSILKFEVEELENTDIFDTCEDLYDIKYDMDNINSCIKSTLDFFYKHFKTKKLYAKWLTTKTMVKQLYEGDTYNIRKIKINDDFLIASDLGEQGVLFVSKSDFDVIL